MLFEDKLLQQSDDDVSWEEHQYLEERTSSGFFWRSFARPDSTAFDPSGLRWPVTWVRRCAMAKLA